MNSFSAGSPFLQRQVPSGANVPTSFYSNAYVKMEANGLAMADISLFDEDVIVRIKLARDNYVRMMRETNCLFQEQLQIQEKARKETSSELQRLTELIKKREDEDQQQMLAQKTENGEENSAVGTDDNNRQQCGVGSVVGDTDCHHDEMVDLKDRLCGKKMELHKVKSQRIRLETERNELQRKAHANNEKLKHEVILLKGVIHKQGSTVCNEQKDLTIDELDQLYDKLLDHHKDMTEAATTNNS
eukprot:GHVS01016802.1.p1 GENE.GHVS01016802.1~~GHVS01016802.1.p1  ORF type:complete len:244 (-),score=52.93 GHVS01016802.1:77-808(-)